MLAAIVGCPGTAEYDSLKTLYKSKQSRRHIVETKENISFVGCSGRFRASLVWRRCSISGMAEDGPLKAFYISKQNVKG